MVRAITESASYQFSSGCWQQVEPGAADSNAAEQQQGDAWQQGAASDGIGRQTRQKQRSEGYEQMRQFHTCLLLPGQHFQALA